ncbi:MAG: amidohydrolase [Candidatus Dormibacteraeota bacterium]|nr:amidohydrolase [Candidatus Dormibacteraeota bacterium]
MSQQRGRGQAIDILLRVGRAEAMTADRRSYGAIAVRGDRIAAVAESRDALDTLAGPRTHVVDDPGLFVYPAFNDTHNHQLWAARDLDYVSLEHARSIAELLTALRDRAARTATGQWIISSRCWHETHLEEGRLPTALELDRASAEHPIFVQRGGHVGVANSRALALAGISATSPDPPRGTVVRQPDGTPTGVLIEADALDPVRRLLPQVSDEQQTGLLERQCRLYNSRGIGIVRDPGLFPDELTIYESLARRAGLSTRTRVMFWVMPGAHPDDALAYIDSLPDPRGFGDEQLRVWGLKMGMDGGVEGGFLCEPYANQPNFHGHAFWEPDDFGRVVEYAVSRDWRVGCHAVGDCAVHRVLDAYEAVVGRHSDLPPGTLVIEHAFLADPEARARAVRANIAITVQHPLLYSLGGNLVRYWGPARTRAVMPVKAWLDDGALVAAGSDCNVSFFDPLLSMWGLLTRGTRTVGVQGPEYRVDRHTAVDLYTAAGGRLLGEAGVIGTLAPNAFADLVAFRTDLMACPVDDLPSLSPALTIVAGRAAYDPDRRLAAPSDLAEPE